MCLSSCRKKNTIERLELFATKNSVTMVPIEIKILCLNILPMKYIIHKVTIVLLNKGIINTLTKFLWRNKASFDLSFHIYLIASTFKSMFMRHLNMKLYSCRKIILINMQILALLLSIDKFRREPYLLNIMSLYLNLEFRLLPQVISNRIQTLNWRLVINCNGHKSTLKLRKLKRNFHIQSHFEW